MGAPLRTLLRHVHKFTKTNLCKHDVFRHKPAKNFVERALSRREKIFSFRKRKRLLRSGSKSLSCRRQNRENCDDNYERNERIHLTSVTIACGKPPSRKRATLD